MRRDSANKNATVVVLLGPPGSGKGTQADQLSRELCIPAISTGQMLRSEAQADSPLARRVRDLVAAGFLVSDDLMNEVLTRRLAQADCAAGFILDGYPRTLPQAIYLDHLFSRLGVHHPFVFDFQISAADVVARLQRRLQCSVCGKIYGSNSNPARRCDRDGGQLFQRDDDNVASIAERLQTYHTNARELVNYCRRYRYYPIAAAHPTDYIAAELSSILMSPGKALAAYHS